MSTLIPPPVRPDVHALIREARRRARRRRARALVVTLVLVLGAAAVWHGGGGHGDGPATRSGGQQRPPAPARASNTARSGGPARTAGFIANSSFIDASRGLLLATSACSSARCALHVDATRDGGRAWQTVARLPVCRGCDGGETIQMINARVGYILGARSFTTADGGHHWIPLQSPLVEAVAAGVGSLFALTYSHPGCPAACDPRVSRARPGQSAFIPQPSAHLVSSGRGETLVAADGALYATDFTNPAVLGPPSGIDVSLDGGTTWHTRTAPCPRGGPATASLATVLAAGGQNVAVLCTSADQHHATVELSRDQGRTFTPTPLPTIAVPGELAVDSHADLAVANGLVGGSGAFRYQLLISRDAGQHWNRTLTRTAVVPAHGRSSSLTIYNAAIRWATGSHTLWASNDGGRSWSTEVAP